MSSQHQPRWETIKQSSPQMHTPNSNAFSYHTSFNCEDEILLHIYLFRFSILKKMYEFKKSNDLHPHMKREREHIHTHPHVTILQITHMEA